MADDNPFGRDAADVRPAAASAPPAPAPAEAPAPAAPAPAAAARPLVQFDTVSKRFGGVRRGRLGPAGYPRRRVLRAARAVGLRQDHAVADARGLRAAERGPRAAQRRGHLRRAAAQAAGQHDVSELRAVSAPVGRGQHRVRPQAGRHARRRDRNARHRDADAGAARGPRRPPSASVVRRPAAARRARPRAGQAAQAAAARRAAVGARPKAPRGDALRADGAAEAARPHLHRRDARPGRGDDGRRAASAS